MTQAAVIQVRGDRDLDGNLATAGYWLDRAAAAGAKLAVLPENFAYFGRRDLVGAAEDEDSEDGPARAFLRDKARQLNLWLVGGTVPIFGERRDRPNAACLVFDPTGTQVARYDKVHLFDVHLEERNLHYRESDDYRPGHRPVTVETPFGRLGIAVCYDLRFPEYFRLLVDAGADILAIPSAFTAATGEAHWQLLLRARAVENLSYVLGANLGHRDHPKRPTWGGSAIVDPRGKVLAAMEGEEGYVSAELDRALLDRVRRNMPALEHRRFFVVKEARH